MYNPEEFFPEFTADVGLKKHEKVDYAILENGSPSILIECKKCSEPLEKRIDDKKSQLYRYFITTTAKFGILTNGLTYLFYTDLEDVNKMDLTPFLEIDIENLTDSSITELKKFSKDSFNPSRLHGSAERLKCLLGTKSVFEDEYKQVSDDFVRFVLDRTNYKGKKSQNVVDKFAPEIQKAFSSFINDKVNERIRAALISDTPEDSSKIVTTDEEIKAFYIVRGLLCELIPIEDIAYRDAQSYFSVLYKNNNRKPICRIKLDSKDKRLYIPKAGSDGGDREFERLHIESANDIYKHKSKLIAAVKRYL